MLSKCIHDNKFIIDLKEKAEPINIFFAEQFSLSKNNNIKVPNSFPSLTEKPFSNIQISNEDIIKIISSFTSNKTNGYDMISIQLLKLLGLSLCKPLSIIFNSCFS